MKKNNEEILSKLKKAFENSTPDVLDSVLKECKSGKGRIITMTEKKRISKFTKGMVAMAACLTLVLGGFGGFFAYNNNYAVAATVSLDVNPSVEIKVNEKEKVLEVLALNEDAVDVIGNMDFKGSSLELTVNALVGSMFSKGYINDNASSILISVDGKNDTTALRNKLTSEVADLINNDKFDGSVISQMVTNDESLKSLAEKYGISAGKAQLINTIISVYPDKTFEELAEYTITELCLILGEDDFTKVNDSVDVEVEGAIADRTYVGKEAALDTALEKYGLSNDQVKDTDVKLEVLDGTIIYAVKLTAELPFRIVNYTIHINAVTGQCLGCELKFTIISDLVSISPDSFYDFVPENEHLTPDEVIEIVCKKVGVKKDNAEITVHLAKTGEKYIYCINGIFNDDVFMLDVYSDTGEILNIIINGNL